MQHAGIIIQNVSIIVQHAIQKSNFEFRATSIIHYTAILYFQCRDVENTKENLRLSVGTIIRVNLYVGKDN